MRIPVEFPDRASRPELKADNLTPSKYLLVQKSLDRLALLGQTLQNPVVTQMAQEFQELVEILFPGYVNYGSDVVLSLLTEGEINEIQLQRRETRKEELIKASRGYGQRTVRCSRKELDLWVEIHPTIKFVCMVGGEQVPFDPETNDAPECSGIIEK